MKLSTTRRAPDLGGRRGSAANLIFLFAAACSPATAHFNLFPDGDLQAVNKKLRNPVQVDPIDHIISNSDVLSGADGCPDLFVAGTSYEEGDLVEKNTDVHKCKSWPNAQWCSMSGYEPGGDNSDKAWDVFGHCEESIDPVPSAAVDERKLDVVAGSLAPYSPDNTDGASDQVSVTSGGGSIAYQRDQFPHEVYCNQRAPGEVAEGFKSAITTSTTSPNPSNTQCDVNSSVCVDRRDESCACVHLECLPDQTGVSITGLARGVCSEMETNTSAASVSLPPTAVSISYAAPVSSSPTSSPVTIELDARSTSGAMSTIFVSKGVDGSKSSYFPTNKGIGNWLEVDLNSQFSGEDLEFLVKDGGNNPYCLCRLTSSKFLYDGAGNTEDTRERTTVTMTNTPCSTSSPSKQPTKATTTTLSIESPSKNPPTPSPTNAGGYLDPFNKVNIQTTSDLDPDQSEVLVFSNGSRKRVSISLILAFVLIVVLDYLNLREIKFSIESRKETVPQLLNTDDMQEVLNSCDTRGRCPIRKEVCLTNQLIDLYHVYTGVVYTIPESNMNISNLKAFVTLGQRQGLECHVSSSHRITKSNHSIQYVEGIVQRTIAVSRDQIKGVRNGSNSIIVFPAYGKNSMFGEKTFHWPDYTTAFLVGEEVCFWPIVAPMLASNETDASFLMRDNRTKNAIHRQKILVSGGFFDNFWHAMLILNDLCQFRHEQDLSLLVQTNGPSIQPFVYDVASALGIDKSRIIHHDRPIIAETIFTSPLIVDWSCLHGALKKDNKQTIALVYQRPGKDPNRDIPPDIHSELVNELSVALGIPVKTFNGTGSLDETRELFSSAKIVIGPHGAGLANLIFVSSHWVPVIEYITPSLLDRPWQLYGGGSFGLPWFPVLLSSFENRDEVMRGVHVAKEALIIAEEQLGE